MDIINVLQRKSQFKTLYLIKDTQADLIDGLKKDVTQILGYFATEKNLGLSAPLIY